MFSCKGTFFQLEVGHSEAFTTVFLSFSRAGPEQLKVASW